MGVAPLADPDQARADALARLYDLDLAEEPGDVDLYLALARRTGGPIVELAAGSGRVSVPLAADGYDVVGVDDDPAMLDRGRRRARADGSKTDGSKTDGSTTDVRLTLVEADLVGCDADPRVAGSGPYRLAILALNSVLLLASAERQRAAIATMARLLAPGGLAIVDAWQPSPADLVAFDGRLSLEWLRTDPETGNEVTKTVAAWLDSATRLVTLTTIFEEGAPGASPARWTRTDALRLATADELTGWVRDAGLDVEQVGGDHELTPLGPGAERAVIVARRG